MKSYTATISGLKQKDGSYHYQIQSHLEIPQSYVCPKTFESEDEMVTVVNGILSTQEIGGDVRVSLVDIKAGHREYFWNLTDKQAESLGWPPQVA